MLSDFIEKSTRSALRYIVKNNTSGYVNRDNPAICRKSIVLNVLARLI